jgi:hypothetical protein
VAGPGAGCSGSAEAPPPLGDAAGATSVKLGDGESSNGMLAMASADSKDGWSLLYAAATCAANRAAGSGAASSPAGAAPGGA